MKGHLQLFILLGFCAVMQGFAQSATLTVNSTTYQKITGFGGFVCSPQFGYNHMTTDEIRKIWGKDSETGFNIMRLYIPIGSTSASESNPSSWSQSLATAQLGKSLGIKIFASPWSMPAEWKTYNTVNGVFVDANNVKQDNYLLPMSIQTMPITSMVMRLISKITVQNWMPFLSKMNLTGVLLMQAVFGHQHKYPILSKTMVNR